MARFEALIDRFLRRDAREEGGLRPDRELLEASFGEREDDRFAAAELGGFRLHGRIDRIDVAPDGRALIRDYKLSKKVTAAAKLVEEGKLQLPLYLLAARGFGIDPVGGLYSPLGATSDDRPRGLIDAEVKGELIPSATDLNVKTDFVDREAFDEILEDGPRPGGRARRRDPRRRDRPEPARRRVPDAGATWRRSAGSSAAPRSPTRRPRRTRPRHERHGLRRNRAAQPRVVRRRGGPRGRGARRGALRARRHPRAGGGRSTRATATSSSRRAPAPARRASSSTATATPSTSTRSSRSGSSPSPSPSGPRPRCDAAWARSSRSAAPTPTTRSVASGCSRRRARASAHRSRRSTASAGACSPPTPSPRGSTPASACSTPTSRRGSPREAYEQALGSLGAGDPDVVRAAAGYRHRLPGMIRAAHSDLRNRGWRRPELPPMQLGGIERGAGENGTPADLEHAASTYDALRRLLAAYGDRYEQLCARRSGVDFDDLQLLALALLRERRAIAEAQRERFDHLLVDEFQDTSPIQVDLVRALTGPATRLFAVGDEFQSIYAFRGADLSSFRRERERMRPRRQRPRPAAERQLPLRSRRRRRRQRRRRRPARRLRAAPGRARPRGAPQPARRGRPSSCC